MIGIAISVEAFEAIARTLPLGNVSFENVTDEHGQHLIWLDPNVVDRLRSLCGPGESYFRRNFVAGGGGRAMRPDLAGVLHAKTTLSLGKPPGEPARKENGNGSIK